MPGPQFSSSIFKLIVVFTTMVLSFPVLSQNSSYFFPDNPAFSESAACVAGGADRCLPINSDTLNSLDSCAPTVNIAGSISSIGYLLINNYASSIFFQEMANRTKTNIECQKSLLRPEHRTALMNSAWSAYNSMQRLIVALRQKSAALQREYDSHALGAADPRTGEVSRRARTQLMSQMTAISNAINGFYEQVPFGAQEPTKEALKSVSNRIIVRAEFDRIYGGTLQENYRVLSESQTSWRTNPRTKEVELTFAQKRELYNSPGAQALINELDPQRRTIGCRFDACYKRGSENIRTGALIALGGAAVVVSLGAATPMFAAAATIGSAAFSYHQIQEACFRDTTAIDTTPTNQCSIDSISQYTVNKVEALTCASELALSLLDVAPGGVLAARALLARRLAVRPPTRLISGSTDEVARTANVAPNPAPAVSEVIVVTGPSRLTTAFNRIQDVRYERNVRRYTDQVRREQRGLTNNEALARARVMAQAKRARLDTLHRQCTSVRPNAETLRAGSLFARYGLGVTAVSTPISYSIANWDKVKDEQWAASLGYEFVQAITLSYLTSKITSSSGMSFPRKVMQNNLVQFYGNIAEAFVHQGLFNNKEEAMAAVNSLATSPNFESDVNKLLDHLHNQNDIQRFVDGMGDMSNNFLRAVTGRERVQDMTARELAALDQRTLSDPEVRMRLLDLVDDQLYSSGMDVTSGSAGLDRLSFNTGYNLASIPVNTAIGVATFYAVCMNIDNPTRAFGAFLSIQGARAVGSGSLYYQTRSEVINQ